MADVIPVPAPVRIPVRGSGTLSSGRFPVRRIHCVGRNFADHAREMGAQVAASPAERGQPVFFTKPADAIVLDGVVPYPRATRELHHEVELVVALGADAPEGVLDPSEADALVFGYAIGLDLTRRDLQAAMKAKGLPWDIAKAFDASAPVSEIVPAREVGSLASRSITLDVNGTRRQHGALHDLVWSVPEILHELSRLYALRAGDLIFMGTPAGVGPLVPGDRFEARLDDIVSLTGRVTGAMPPA
ncbi:fumarylacetoacetase [Lysobacter bugurensis]|uniref:Fumarylacetoacetase n=1 Tax=Cognatilysobacter bugurensis TaxID=543356 RepID=A0A918WAI6_9GAMM|nr:fumarylacetoacetate hydrolase family protein [Lysobacter bugurensis]GHA89229.1 fumarylacetoacetase [Lysobacter bugurensis]